MKKSSLPPNLFIIGAPKAGTTAIVTELGNHPNIFLPREKEPRFFDASVFYDDPELYPIKDIEDYLALYDSEAAASAEYRIDGSVFNMYSQASIESILRLNPSAKFILVLRDPLDATKSMFIQRLKHASGPMRELADDFPHCWTKLQDRKIGLGFPPKCKTKFLFRYDLLYSYENYLPMLHHQIPAEQLLILKYEDLKKDALSFYKSIYEYLSLPFSGEVRNESVNLSVPHKKSFIHSLIKVIANLTRPIREKIGLTGIMTVNQIAAVRELDLSSLGLHSIDDQVIAEFENTYVYLKDTGLYEMRG